MRRQRGVALIMVLLCLALVAFLMTEFTEQGRRDIQRLARLQAETQARFHAQGAELLAQRMLTDPTGRRSAQWWRWLGGEPRRLPTDEGEVVLRLQDERTCFNLNALAQQETALVERQLRRLLTLEGAQENPDRLVARLADWIDADAQPRPGSLDGVDYVSSVPSRTSADMPLADISEINWVEPLDPSRVRRHPSLCVLPDRGPWRLNLNTLAADQLPLLDALFEGQISRDSLSRLIAARPEAGFTGLDDLQARLGGQAEWLRELGDRLTLSPDYVTLHIEIEVSGQRFRFTRLLQAEGVSNWTPSVPAARVRVLARSSLPVFQEFPP
ncbi:type II secretion system minor pseudopilin GspK [Halomonas sp. TRM85114]|uniref:type II secretion system minor pseudopilin GspK n=1 Tax=Halomonas jincaotanensis TaxID=2810616 RepID=UPI001BD38934|nr:type II secretion system minor pseudopilin GspK [Halomonas jincaotanensis]MBS9403126.1 type II secretion system minor pseudopilin GspK [Halomonas jincaotanensis]